MSMRFYALLTALVLLCTGCGTTAPNTSTSVSADTSVSLSAPDFSAPEQVPAPDEATPEPPAPVAPPVEKTIAPEPPIPEAPPVSLPEPELEPIVPDYEPEVPAVTVTPQIVSTYDFSSPVPESQPVETDYFADAAFVGDSRTEGFWLYSGVKQGKLLSATGLTVFSVNSKTAINSNQTVLQALTGGKFGKIYLSFGINELGYIDTDSFVDSYCNLIDTIRAAHPEAILYIQNLIPVNDYEARASGLQGHVNCDRVRLYNEFIAQIAAKKQVPLLDLYSAYAVDGQLPAEDSRDGVHLLPQACKKQLTYFMTHTVTWEQLTAQPSTEPPVDTPEVLPETEVTEI